MVTGLNIIGSNKALQDHYIKRIVAIIIDSVILFVVSIVIMAVAFTFTFGGVFFGIGALILGLVTVLYFIILEAFAGGTLGKRIMGLRVVGTTGPMDIVKAFIRNFSKIHWLLLLLDLLVGLGTEGDPRQKMSDRWGGTTVVRSDPQAYVEEQFRQMATPPPHPAAPSAAWGQPGTPPPAPAGGPPAQAPYQPPQQAPAAQGWGQQAPSSQGAWPQHRWDEQGNLSQAPKFCQQCGTSLVARGDGKMTCPVDGSVY